MVVPDVVDLCASLAGGDDKLLAGACELLPELVLTVAVCGLAMARYNSDERYSKSRQWASRIWPLGAAKPLIDSTIS